MKPEKPVREGREGARRKHRRLQTLNIPGHWETHGMVAIQPGMAGRLCASVGHDPAAPASRLFAFFADKLFFHP
jgi:hypothetical protein